MEKSTKNNMNGHSYCPKDSLDQTDEVSYLTFFNLNPVDKVDRNNVYLPNRLGFLTRVFIRKMSLVVSFNSFYI